VLHFGSIPLCIEAEHAISHRRALKAFRDFFDRYAALGHVSVGSFDDFRIAQWGLDSAEFPLTSPADTLSPTGGE